MARKFQVHEAIPDGTKRILDESLAQIEFALATKSMNNRRAVHRARRGCKRVRAVLRLVRSDLGDRWKLEDRWCRDLSRSLSGARDADVCLATLGKLEKRFGNLLRPGVFKTARRHLKAGPKAATPKVKKLRKAAAREVGRARKRIEELPLTTNAFEVLGAGLERSYGRGARLYRRARKTGRPVHFHDLRKRVKDLYYQLGTLEASAPLVLRAERRRLLELGEVLGDSQDLYLFRHTLSDRRDDLDGGGDLHLLRVVAKGWERELDAEALEKSRPIFTRPPEEFVGGLEGHWILWKGVSPTPDLWARGSTHEFPKPSRLRIPSIGQK